MGNVVSPKRLKSKVLVLTLRIKADVCVVEGRSEVDLNSSMLGLWLGRLVIRG